MTGPNPFLRGLDGKHACPARGCPVRVSRTRLACPKHWHSLPGDLRAAITATWKNRDLDGMARYLQLRRDAVDHLNPKENEHA